MRTHPVPASNSVPLSVYRDAAILKRDVDYAAAKAGDGQAASRLIARHAGPLVAELADFIQAQRGEVAGVAVLANASRSGHLVAEERVVRILERRFGAELEQAFGIRPAALTRDEAQYLVGFRTADEFRNRAVKAGQARIERLRARGLSDLAGGTQIG